MQIVEERISDFLSEYQTFQAKLKQYNIRNNIYEKGGNRKSREKEKKDWKQSKKSQK